MIPYKLDFVIEEMNSADLAAQGLLQAYTGKVIPKFEAGKVWERIPDHKWYLSERLGRDVGMRVAAVDFVENFYEPTKKQRSRSGLSKSLQNIRLRVGGWLVTYFTAKSGLTPL
jgi:hypothetical protein